MYKSDRIYVLQKLQLHTFYPGNWDDCKSTHLIFVVMKDLSAFSQFLQDTPESPSLPVMKTLTNVLQLRERVS